MKKYLIGGYGTLLYQGSLNKSLRRKGSDNKPLVDYIPYFASGFKRLFNLSAPHYTPSDKMSGSAIENSAANIIRDQESVFNGLCFYVTESEIESLDERERYYDREETEFFHFETKKSLGTGYLYISNYDNRHLIKKSIHELLPCWSDLLMARSGAYKISKKFGEYYDNSTYLADGQTLALHFYRRSGIELNDFML